MTAKSADPILLTPGPLTTTLQTKRAQLRDYGSRDIAFIDMTANLIAQLNAIVHGGDDHACVLMQGSGTFAVEAALGTLIPRTGHPPELDEPAAIKAIDGLLELVTR